MKLSRAATRLLLGVAGSAVLLACSRLVLQAQSSKKIRPPLSIVLDPQMGTPSDCIETVKGSPYIPVDSWMYPAVLRLYSMGFVDHVYLGMRPWTRKNVGGILDDVKDRIAEAGFDTNTDEAQRIHDALKHELRLDVVDPCKGSSIRLRLESAYSVSRGMSGTPLRDSFHLGSTLINDYGRPYENGLSNYTGLSGYVNAGRFTLYARGEFQGAPSATGYSSTLANSLSAIDQTLYTDTTTGQTTYYYPQATIPTGPIASAAHGRVMEAYISANVLSHEVSFGKVDQWLGPAKGASFAYSNNAENVYAFEINRVEPLRIPLLSNVTGPFRYEFLVGELHGHRFMPNPAYQANPSPSNVINPGNPWVQVEKISFKPTRDLEFGFERTIIWGGHGHEPVTLHTFLRSFFSFDSVAPAVKHSAQDPGARFGAFDFAYRLPFARNWLTIYTDSEAHDAVSPLFKPLHGCFRPGLYLSHVPHIPRLDLRVEGVDTDSSIPSSIEGRYQYWEDVQTQGYTNNGQLFGDWVGREDKGGQAWITYHLSGNEWIQLSARNQKAAKDFIASPTTQYGTTLNDIGVQAVKRLGQDFEINGNFTVERYKAPIYLPGLQTVTTTNIQLTWYPSRKIDF